MFTAHMYRVCSASLRGERIVQCTRIGMNPRSQGWGIDRSGKKCRRCVLDLLYSVYLKLEFQKLTYTPFSRQLWKCKLRQILGLELRIGSLHLARDTMTTSLYWSNNTAAIFSTKQLTPSKASNIGQSVFSRNKSYEELGRRRFSVWTLQGPVNDGLADKTRNSAAGPLTLLSRHGTSRHMLVFQAEEG